MTWALVIVALAALGEPTHEGAEELLRRGVQLRRERRDLEALEQFRAAHALSPSGRTLAQIALAEQALGQFVEAERDLLAALASRDPWISKNLATLEGARSAIEARLARLVVECDTPGAVVSVDGRAAGPAPLAGPIRVLAGERSVEARERDRVVSARVTLAPGAVGRVRLALEPEARPSPSLTSPAEPPGRPLRVGAWIGVASAGLLLAGGIAAHVSREDLAAEWNDDQRCLFGGLSREEACGGLRADAERAEALAIAAYSASGAALAAAIVLFALDAAEPTVACAPSGPGVSCAARF